MTKQTSSNTCGYSPDGQNGANPKGSFPPLFADMCLLDNRLSTYTAKFRDLSKCQHSCEELAVGGLFYSGEGDCVRCFYCGLGMKGWLPGDDMYTLHEKYQPNCAFLQAIKKSGNNSNYEMLRAMNETKLPMSAEDVSLWLVQRENFYHQRRQLCQMCFRKPALELLMPCGEMVICVSCSEIVNFCPACHTKILATASVFLP